MSDINVFNVIYKIIFLQCYEYYTIYSVYIHIYMFSFFNGDYNIIIIIICLIFFLTTLKK